MGHPTKTEKYRVRQEQARRRRRLRLLVVAALILPALAGGVYALLAWSVPIGKPVPAFTLENQDGQRMTLSDFRGKQPVALIFYMVAT
ncbi:MAG: redoxin domain-containing protein [candidate division NC10 bacterium]|nr:redoxin domain-containing protein [candidate division NC10 bacterium]